MRTDGQPAIFLVDNGSLRPQATLSLRRIARSVGDRCGVRVEAVSLLHSHKVPAEKLGGVPAEIVEPAIEKRCEAGVRDFLIVPLFFGPSLALTDYIPKVVARLQAGRPGLRVEVAPWLIHSQEDEKQVAGALADMVRGEVQTRSLQKPAAALVDHGSPVKVVTDVRDRMARRLGDLLACEVRCVRPCSMERREEPEYGFNEPLLERLLREPGIAGRELVLALLFLQPGRHAGPGGDIATICAEAEQEHPGLMVYPTGLLGERPELVAILATRVREGLRRLVYVL